MQRLAQPFSAVAALLVVASCGGASQRARVATPPITAAATTAATAARASATAPPETQAEPVAWAERLGPLRFRPTHGGDGIEVRLYRPDGSPDEREVEKLDGLLDDAPDGEKPRAIDRRLVRLVVKAAAHFHATDVLVVSSWRESKRPGSRHATGQAIDFFLSGIASGTLAQHLRTYARVGVGVYTHPRTRFVHLDVRDESFHWLDSSPPGRTWREHGITDRAAILRDRSYDPEQDLPG